jgi:hypothetical protein
MIEKFSRQASGEKRNIKLARLMAAVLENINAERGSVIAGIERFTKKQRALAQSVRDTRKQFDAVLAIADPSKADDAKRRELEQQLIWQTRIYDERERSLKYVCESPVLLEQRSFVIAREIANHLVD